MGLLSKAERAFYGTGRRKTSVAKVWIVLPGTGKIKVNKIPSEEYFPSRTYLPALQKPFEVTNTSGKFDVLAIVEGGGKSAQRDAVILGISRALVQFDETLKPSLSKAGLLTRDPRKKERKKYGQPGRRKQYQYHKR